MDLYKFFYKLQHLTVSPLYAILALIILTLIIILIFKLVILRNNAAPYINSFEAAYSEKGNVVYALNQALASYRAKSREAATIRYAISYLEQSILRDYETAFKMIERNIGGPKVHALHERVLAEEKTKKITQFMLCENNKSKN